MKLNWVGLEVEGMVVGGEGDYEMVWLGGKFFFGDLGWKRAGGGSWISWCIPTFVVFAQGNVVL